MLADNTIFPKYEQIHNADCAEVNRIKPCWIDLCFWDMILDPLRKVPAKYQLCLRRGSVLLYTTTDGNEKLAANLVDNLFNAFVL